MAAGIAAASPRRAAASWLWCTLALAAAPLPSSARAAEAAADLGRMATAIRQLDYQGSLVYEHDGVVDALRLFHRGGADERERLVSLGGDRSEVVRSGNAITCLRDGAPVLLLGDRATRLLPLVPSPRPGFTRYYTVRHAGSGRVAGYPARVVDIEPRDTWRYGYRLWLEEASDLPLRAAIVEPVHRTVLEQFMFVALEMGVKPNPTDLMPTTLAGPADAPADVVALAATRWHLADAPPGFAFVRAQQPAHDAGGAEQQVWSDGLASVSVYVEPRPTSGTAKGAAPAAGVLSLYTRDLGRWRITVVGDVPQATAERISLGLQLSPGLESH
jgi:sigma-E factor negative regulatory protein RseB